MANETADGQEQEGFRVIESNRFRSGGNLAADVAIWHRQMLGQKARYCAALIERWGMVQGFEAGEDSTGRAKIGLMEPKLVIDRAVETTKLAWEAFEAAGWIIDCPSPDEADDMLAEKQNGEEKERGRRRKHRDD